MKAHIKVVNKVIGAMTFILKTDEVALDTKYI